MTSPKGDEKSKVHYFSVNPNGEAEDGKNNFSLQIRKPELKNLNFLLKRWISAAGIVSVTR